MARNRTTAPAFPTWPTANVLQPHSRSNQQIPSRPRLLRRHALPLYPISDAGLKIAAHLYNRNMKLHGGQLKRAQRKDAQRAAAQNAWSGTSSAARADHIEPMPWQTDTCMAVGITTARSRQAPIQDRRDGHPDPRRYRQQERQPAAQYSGARRRHDRCRRSRSRRRNHPLDGHQSRVHLRDPALEGLRRRPASKAAPLRAQGFNEGAENRSPPKTVRFTTTKDGTLYDPARGSPAGRRVKSLGNSAGDARPAHRADVSLLGSDQKLAWKQTGDGCAGAFAAPRADALAGGAGLQGEAQELGRRIRTARSI